MLSTPPPPISLFSNKFRINPVIPYGINHCFPSPFTLSEILNPSVSLLPMISPAFTDTTRAGFSVAFDAICQPPFFPLIFPLPALWENILPVSFLTFVFHSVERQFLFLLFPWGKGCSRSPFPFWFMHRPWWPCLPSGSLPGSTCCGLQLDVCSIHTHVPIAEENVIMVYAPRR